jgi:hypothetical protein
VELFHRRIFGGLYPWAEDLRIVQIAKPGAFYARPANVLGLSRPGVGRSMWRCRDACTVGVVDGLRAVTQVGEFVVKNTDYHDRSTFAKATADHIRYHDGPHRDRQFIQAERRLLIAA